MSFHAHVNENYLARYFNGSSVEETNIYLLAEEHESAACEGLHGKLISLLAEHLPVTVLVEGKTSMQEAMLSKSRMKELTYIDPSIHEDHLCFRGWDIDPSSLSEQKMILLDLMKQQTVLYRQFADLDATLKSSIANIKPIFPNYPDIPHEAFFKLPKDTLASFMENMRKVHETTLAEKALGEQINEISEKISSTDKSLIEGNFPKRTAAMVATLQKINTMRQEGTLSGKVVLIAGKGHLQTLKKDEGNAAFDLSPLYEELKHHKASILTPKIITDV